jgi:hypothetical protein
LLRDGAHIAMRTQHLIAAGSAGVQVPKRRSKHGADGGTSSEVTESSSS